MGEKFCSFIFVKTFRNFPLALCWRDGGENFPFHIKDKIAMATLRKMRCDRLPFSFLYWLFLPRFCSASLLRSNVSKWSLRNEKISNDFFYFEIFWSAQIEKEGEGH